MRVEIRTGSNHRRSRPNLTSSGKDRRAYENNLILDFIRPGESIENALVESFKGRFCDECLIEHVFASPQDTRRKIGVWRMDFNQNRQYDGINNLTPDEFAEITSLNLP